MAQDRSLRAPTSIEIVPGVAFLNPADTLWAKMAEGWERQQRSRGLASTTVDSAMQVVRRFQAFCGTHPWEWEPADLEDFTFSLMSGRQPLAKSTIRNYHLTIKAFCDYICDTRYPWADLSADTFGQRPTQICHEYNTAAHLIDYEGIPSRRPFSYDEVQTLFDYADARVAHRVADGKKGALAALRDASMIKVAYAYGLRRAELINLDIQDLHTNPAMPRYKDLGALHIRFGKASKGSAPKRRTVLTVPEFDWVVPVLEQWRSEARPLFNLENFSALWPTERHSRVQPDFFERRFKAIRTGAGLPPELTLHCLRHSYVTHLTEFGYPVEVIRQQVGHQFAATTQIYTSVSDDFRNRTLRAAFERLNN